MFCLETLHGVKTGIGRTFVPDKLTAVVVLALDNMCYVHGESPI